MSLIFIYTFLIFLLHLLNQSSPGKFLPHNLGAHISSNFISIQSNNRETYDLLQTFAYNSADYLNIFCIAHDYKNSAVSSNLIQTFYFEGLTYFYLKFENMTKYTEYEIICSDIQTKEPLDIRTIRFPKTDSITNLLTFGDWSLSPEGDASADLIRYKFLDKTDAVLFLGDIAYDLNEEKGERGNTFLNYIKDITSVVPFQMSVGNHEMFNDYIEYQKRFYLPNQDENKTFYYSYDINNVHVIALNSEVEFDSTFSENYKKAMIAWLEQDLMLTQAKWRIVYMHRPLYCSKDNNDCNNDAKKLRGLFEEIFSLYKVDLVVTGHRHQYERMYPVFKEDVDSSSLFNSNNTYSNPRYPAYVICGSTGNSEEMETEVYASKYYSKVVANTFGICHVEINSNELLFRHILTKTEEVFDQFSIIKS